MRTVRKKFDWIPIVGVVQYFFCKARIRDQHFDRLPDEWFYYHMALMLIAMILIGLFLGLYSSGMLKHFP